MFKRVARPSVLAVLERIANRAAFAIVNLALVFFVTPQDMGLYAAGLLAYSLVQTAGDLAVRQVAAPLWWADGGERAIRRAAIVCGVLSITAMATFAAVLVAATSAQFEDGVFVASLSIAGLCAAVALPRMTAAQARGKWGMIARKQAIASGISLVIALCVLPFWGVGAGFLQLLIVEFMLLILLPPVNEPFEIRTSNGSPRRQIAHMSASNLMGWLQAQSERVALGVVGGGAVLGLYSTAYQLARAPSDPVGTGLLVVLRNKLASAPDRDSHLFDTGIRRASIVGLILQTGTVLLLIIPMSAVLPEVWRSAIVPAIILTATIPIVVPMMSMSTLLVVRDRTKELYPWQLLGILMSVCCGLGFASSLTLGASMVIARDLIATLGRLHLVRKDVRIQTIGVLALGVLGSSIVVAVAIAAASEGAG